MPTPNLPAGFDFTDPDIYTERLPMEEFAELRASAPIWWNEQAPGNGGGLPRRWLLGHHQTRRRQGGVAAQRRLLQLTRTA